MAGSWYVINKNKYMVCLTPYACGLQVDNRSERSTSENDCTRTYNSTCDWNPDDSHRYSVASISLTCYSTKRWRLSYWDCWPSWSYQDDPRGREIPWRKSMVPCDPFHRHWPLGSNKSLLLKTKCAQRAGLIRTAISRRKTAKLQKTTIHRFRDTGLYGIWWSSFRHISNNLGTGTLLLIGP